MRASQTANNGSYFGYLLQIALHPIHDNFMCMLREIRNPALQTGISVLQICNDPIGHHTHHEPTNLRCQLFQALTCKPEVIFGVRDINRQSAQRQEVRTVDDHLVFAVVIMDRHSCKHELAGFQIRL